MNAAVSSDFFFFVLFPAETNKQKSFQLNPEYLYVKFCNGEYLEEGNFILF